MPPNVSVLVAPVVTRRSFSLHWSASWRRMQVHYDPVCVSVSVSFHLLQREPDFFFFNACARRLLLTHNHRTRETAAFHCRPNVNKTWSSSSSGVASRRAAEFICSAWIWPRSCEFAAEVAWKRRARCEPTRSASYCVTLTEIVFSHSWCLILWYAFNLIIRTAWKKGFAVFCSIWWQISFGGETKKIKGGFKLITFGLFPAFGLLRH